MAPSRSEVRESHRSGGRRRRGGAAGAVADWADADPIAIQVVIANVTRAGGAVTFGYTRDGGAYAMGFMGDGDRYTDYIRPDESINSVLTEIAKLWSD